MARNLNSPSFDNTPILPDSEISDALKEMEREVKGEISQEKISQIETANNSELQWNTMRDKLSKEKVSPESVIINQTQIVSNFGILIDYVGNISKQMDEKIKSTVESADHFMFGSTPQGRTKELLKHIVSVSNATITSSDITGGGDIFENIAGTKNTITAQAELQGLSSKEKQKVLWNIHILNEYLKLYLTEFDLIQSKSNLEKELEKEDVKNYDAKGIEKLLDQYNKKLDNYNTLKKELAETQASIYTATNEITQSMPEVEVEVPTLRGTIKSELDKWLRGQSNNQSDNSVEAQRKREQQEKIEQYLELVTMYEEYSTYLTKHSFQSGKEYRKRIEEHFIELTENAERNIVDGLGQELYTEAINLGGNRLNDAQRKAFLEDFYILYNEHKDEQLSLSESGDNITALRRVMQGTAVVPKYVTLLIKHGIFDGHTDIAYHIGIYGGKKTIVMSIDGVAKGSHAWLSNLTIGGIKFSLDELENTLFGIDYNSREAMLATLFKQTRVMGQYGANIANMFINTTTLLLTDFTAGSDPGINRMKSIQGFEKQMKDETSYFYRMLDILKKHISKNSSGNEIKKLDYIISQHNHTMERAITEVVDIAKGAGHLTAWSTKHEVFKDANSAIESFKSYVKSNNINIDKGFMTTVETCFGSCKDRTTAHGRKNQVGIAISSSLESKSSGLIHAIKNNNLVKTQLDTFIPSLRKSIVDIAEGIGGMRSVFETYFRVESGRGILHGIKKPTTELLNNAKFAKIITDLTQVSRQGYARFGSATEMKEFTANLQTLLKYFPTLAGNILRSSPIAFLIADQINNETETELGKLARMLVPVLGPALIIDDGLGSHGIKFGEVAMGGFFLGAESGYLIASFVGGGAKGAGNAFQKLLFDPIYATGELAKTIGSASGTAVNTAKSVPSVLPKVGLKDLFKMGAAGAVLITSGVYSYNYIKSIELKKIRAYFSYREGKKQYKHTYTDQTGKEQKVTYTNPVEGARAYLHANWTVFSNKQKETILQHEFEKYFAEDFYENPDNLNNRDNRKPHKPGRVSVKITESNEIRVIMHDVLLDYELIQSFFTNAVTHVEKILPDSTTERVPGVDISESNQLKFRKVLGKDGKYEYKSLYIGADVFDNFIIDRISASVDEKTGEQKSLETIKEEFDQYLKGLYDNKNDLTYIETKVQELGDFIIANDHIYGDGFDAEWLKGNIMYYISQMKDPTVDEQE